MIIIKLSSGLGNQLFQYSLALYLKENTDQEILFDLNSFKNDFSKRSFELKILNPPFDFFHDTSLYTNAVGKIRYYYKLLCYFKYNIITERNFLSKKLSTKKPNFYDGFWQTNYFAEKINVRNHLIIHHPQPNFIRELETEIRNNESISLHVRRGDYFSNTYVKRYGVCTPEYYQNAINFFKNQNHKQKYFIFSDDLDWVKEKLILPEDSVFVPNNDINSFWYIQLMSLCHHNIISNSSFSWWGAYLNENTEKMVIAPEKWMNDTNKTIALRDWIKIPTK